jgi:opacity protein-like surface antigen
VSAAHIRAVAVAAALAALAASSAPAAAAPAPHGYQQNDAGGFRNILPPGQGQNVNVGEAAAFLGSDQQPAFSDDQLQMYEDLVYATPGLPDSQVDNFFKDASFGVRPGDVTRTYTPVCILPTAPQSP